MSINAKPTPGKALLSPSNHALILIDFQSQMSFATKSIDAVNLRTNAALISQAAAGFKVPTTVFVLDQIPRTPTGKVQRRRIAEQLTGAL